MIEIRGIGTRLLRHGTGSDLCSGSLKLFPVLFPVRLPDWAPALAWSRVALAMSSASEKVMRCEVDAAASSARYWASDVTGERRDRPANDRRLCRGRL